MAFPDVLRIARRHFRSLMSAPVGVVVVNEWLDDSGLPISLHVFRLSADDTQAIADCRRKWGELGEKCSTIARACYLIDGADKRRAFVDTDLDAMRTSVDVGTIDNIYLQVIQLLGA